MGISFKEGRKLPKVTFLPLNKTVIATEGDLLIEVARKHDIFIDAPCNGSKTCGKCKVRISSGEVYTQKNLHITQEEIDNGYVLSCDTRIKSSDITVELINIESSALNNMQIQSISTERDQLIFENSRKQLIDNDMEFGTYVKKDYIEIGLPNLDDNISDFDRLKREMRTKLGYSQVFMRLPMLRKMPFILRNGDFKVTVTHIPRGKRTTVVNIELGNTLDRLFGIALDIGTTSVAASLVDLYSGKLIGRASAGNAQMKYGADVINRIIYSTKKEGLDKLNEAIIKDTINPLLQKMYKEADVDMEEVIAFVASGNTTMTHLFLGVYPDFLRMEPYIPAFLRAPFIQAGQLGLEVNPETFIYIAPNVASYVGGDITAGVLASYIWADSQNTLFIDLGTNGEIVFGNQDFLMTCACSAGPAFEGGEISSGMRAAPGAIEEVKINDLFSAPIIKIIGEKSPKGICGSGIIDLIAEMFKNKIIDRRGKLIKDNGNPRIKVDEHGIGSYIVASKEEWPDINEDVCITEVDLDNFIRAKGAVYSGAATLISSLGMSFSELDRVMIAGGIGNSLDIENSIIIGLLPDIPRDKFSYIGNSSLIGSYLTLMSEDARKKMECIASQMTYIELSVYPSYMDEFVSACFLPHTNTDDFPSLSSLLD